MAPDPSDCPFPMDKGLPADAPAQNHPVSGDKIGSGSNSVSASPLGKSAGDSSSVVPPTSLPPPNLNSPYRPAAIRRLSSTSMFQSRERTGPIDALFSEHGVPPIPGQSSTHGSRIHSRAPSLGELHQQLENEQEHQVNRLLHEIQKLRLQNQRLQQQQQQHNHQSDSSAISNSGDDGSLRFATLPAQAGGAVPAMPPPPAPLEQQIFAAPQAVRSHSFSRDIRRSGESARAPSISSGRGGSPRLRSTSISVENADVSTPISASRDEASFYQAETRMLQRENQMLRRRILELERQLADPSYTSGSANAHEPKHASGLSRSMSTADEEDKRRKSPGTMTPDMSTPGLPTPAESTPGAASPTTPAPTPSGVDSLDPSAPTQTK